MSISQFYIHRLPTKIKKVASKKELLYQINVDIQTEFITLNLVLGSVLPNSETLLLLFLFSSAQDLMSCSI